MAVRTLTADGQVTDNEGGRAIVERQAIISAQHQRPRLGRLNRPGVLPLQFLQLGDVGLQFLGIGPADEEKADHLHRAQGRLLSRP